MIPNLANLQKATLQRRLSIFRKAYACTIPLINEDLTNQYLQEIEKGLPLNKIIFDFKEHKIRFATGGYPISKLDSSKLESLTKPFHKESVKDGYYTVTHVLINLDRKTVSFRLMYPYTRKPISWHLEKDFPTELGILKILDDEIFFNIKFFDE